MHRGRLVVYYSSEERKASGYNQILAHKVSTNCSLAIAVGKVDEQLRRVMPIVRRSHQLRSSGLKCRIRNVNL
jgi:hypothetical protein